MNWTVGRWKHVRWLKHLVNTHSSFREMPTFGRDTIRRFSANVSELKQLAARDFEDILQVWHLNFFRRRSNTELDYEVRYSSV